MLCTLPASRNAEKCSARRNQLNVMHRSRGLVGV
jgi:hypothetical protein